MYHKKMDLKANEKVSKEISMKVRKGIYLDVQQQLYNQITKTQISDRKLKFDQLYLDCQK